MRSLTLIGSANIGPVGPWASIPTAEAGGFTPRFGKGPDSSEYRDVRYFRGRPRTTGCHYRAGAVRDFSARWM